MSLYPALTSMAGQWWTVLIFLEVHARRQGSRAARGNSLCGVTLRCRSRVARGVYPPLCSHESRSLVFPDQVPVDAAGTAAVVVPSYPAHTRWYSLPPPLPPCLASYNPPASPCEVRRGLL